MSDATTGWGGEAWLANAAGQLIELAEVLEFELPDDEADEYETTHLKSPGRRKEFKQALLDGGTVAIPLNYVAGSPTDALIREAKASGDIRQVRFVVPDDDGIGAWEVVTSCFVKGYKRGPLQPNAKIVATATLRITGAQTEAAL